MSAGQSAFVNVLAHALIDVTPAVNPAQVIGTGATALRTVFSAATIPGVVESYTKGLQAAYTISIVAAALATIIALASKWRNLKGGTVIATV